MNIKSLLLGSAAALVAVSGARAADAVVIPEPEAVEYVRVCDAAGAGYFYIPGGETCLKISGYVQTQMTFNAGRDGLDVLDGVDQSVNSGSYGPVGVGLDADNLVTFARNTTEYSYEARLQFDAWRDTSYGPLATRIRLTAGNRALMGSSTSGLNVDRAYFDLAGLRMGIDASAWDNSFGGLAGDNPTDALFNGASNGGTLRYTGNFGPVSATLSLEEDSQNDDYIPSVVGVVGFNLAGIKAEVSGVYEDDATATFAPTVWGAKAKASYTTGGFSIGAGAQYSGGARGTTYNADYRWVLGAEAGYDAGAVDFGVGIQYGIDEKAVAGQTMLLIADNDFVIGANVGYDITETLKTNLRVRYFEDASRNGNVADVSGWDARLRFKSTF